MDFLEDIFDGGYGYYGYDPEIMAVISVLTILTAIAGTVLSFIFIIPEKKKEKLPKIFRILHDIFNFNGLIIEKILKALYVFATIYAIAGSFFDIFTGKNFFVCLITMVIAPIVIRIGFELIMMAVLLVKNVISINNKLKNQNEGEAKADFEFNYAALKNEEPAKQEAPSVSVCSTCGAVLNPDAEFCGSCGAPRK